MEPIKNPATLEKEICRCTAALNAKVDAGNGTRAGADCGGAGCRRSRRRRGRG